jgi:hypothetical protein
MPLRGGEQLRSLATPPTRSQEPFNGPRQAIAGDQAVEGGAAEPEFARH